MKVIFQKKRQVFLALFLFLSSASYANDLCRASGALERAQVKRVVDGDTLYLADGRRVRLVGINTPELDHEKGLHEPFAVAAKRRLIQLSGRYVYLQPSKDGRDKYGRYLYYLFDKDRISLSSQLLSAGLGYRVAVPPNLAYQACFQASEQVARNAHLGVWQQSLQWRPQAGFVMARVAITSIAHNRGGWWLETNQGLVINLPPSASDYWPAQKVFFLQGHTVEVRGWQHKRSSRKSKYQSWVLTVKHPNDIKDMDAM
ncbi:thermonuclease family protein [Marinomonas pollencensis]|uniref:Endonuclease YncB(Thermonuclease family) n=1 Tax=Marinomonas pollencensis TaxID=491954 RepID=A0A3E0DKQ1_9GAMM|nr:thermonuclease family protein [Marinomonas pollencensis]REG82356.1 endonuclease YncB(thermonuclease family) [Marinomonas pollencensis]